MLQMVTSYTYRISLLEVIQKVQVLFQGNAVLLNAFYKFLPENLGIDSNVQHYNETEITCVAFHF